MTAQIIDGKTVAASVRDTLKQKIATTCFETGIQPGLAVILVGNNPASEIYVSKKQEACEAVGIASKLLRLDDTLTEKDLINTIEMLNQDDTVHGILLQLPLPSHLNSEHLLERIDPKKDIDGFHPYNMGRLALRHPALHPCTPAGIMTLLNHIKLDVKGLHAVIVGASNIVGRPMALEFLLKGATVTVTHRFTQNLEHHVKQADLLVVAVGKTGIVDSDWIKPGATVIDVGVNRLENGNIVGDIDFETAKEKATWITPVPGGVGPMTVATLLQNTFDAYIQQISSAKQASKTHFLAFFFKFISPNKPS